ncbi:uncharacterized protein LOC144368312 [Ictidomys tridecemlineatus]
MDAEEWRGCIYEEYKSGRVDIQCINIAMKRRKGSHRRQRSWGAGSTCEQKSVPWTPSLMHVGRWSLVSLLQPSISHTRVSTAAVLPACPPAAGGGAAHKGRRWQGSLTRSPAPCASRSESGESGIPEGTTCALRPSPRAQLAPRLRLPPP